jgi:hypothetical protein
MSDFEREADLLRISTTRADLKLSVDAACSAREKSRGGR